MPTGLNRRLSCGKWSFIVNGRKARSSEISAWHLHDRHHRHRRARGRHGHGLRRRTPVGEMADVLGTIPYEIMTGISTRVKRIYTKE
ncbi:MAG: alanine racemase C-terminal domain-containing protein [Alistipes sp.]